MRKQRGEDSIEALQLIEKLQILNSFTEKYFFIKLKYFTCARKQQRKIKKL